ncbi:hypothetical protein C818_00779 [Lachnospiraceae bacterium MD308]|nr:hypothetical protein C818_00779 [Lachnospiraceae bacterium MD308]
MTKKIILLLVEGLTDEEALALVFSKLAKEHDIEFDVLHTDITADENMTVKYIGERIKREIADYLRKNQQTGDCTSAGRVGADGWSAI